MTEEYTESASIEIGRYWTILRRRWVVVVIGVLVGIVLAVGYLAVTSSKATATALVNISLISDQPFNTVKSASGLIDAQTEVQLARSSEVVSSVAETLGGTRTPSQIRDDMSAESVPSATVVKISYTAPTTREAILGANAIALAYIDYRSELGKDKVSSIVAQLQKSQRALEKRFAAVNRALATATQGSAKAVQAASDRDQLNIELGAVLSNINELSGVDTSGGTMLTDAADNGVRIFPSEGLVLASGALLGLILGIIAAFVVNSFDRRVHDARDVAVAGGGTVLARLRTRRGAVPPSEPDLDPIRSLRERLLAILPESNPVVAVVDLARRRHSSDVAANLAIAVAQSGREVVLVLPEHPAEYVQYLVGALALQPIDDSRRPNHFRSRAVDGLVVSVPADDSPAPEGSSSEVSELMRSGDGKGALTVVAVPVEASRSLRLEAGRLGRSVIFVVAVLGTRVDELRQLSGELRAVHSVIHGTVLVPNGRRLDLTSPPTSAPLTAARSHGVTSRRA